MLGQNGQGSAGVSSANSIAAAGGIGGLLGTHDWGADVSSVDDDESYLHFYDANGNTGQLVYAKSNTNSGSTAGNLAAAYEYDVYGNVIAQTGTYVDTNRFRFSTKQFDAESGLGYWGYRYYRPETGRWVSRDPIEEEGGWNLFLFAGNSTPSWIDPLGQTVIGPWESESHKTSSCKFEWRKARIIGDKYHIGIRVTELFGDPWHRDYGHDDDPCPFTANNSLWPEGEVPTGPSGKDDFDDPQGISKCMCDCLKQEAPARFGGRGGYTPFGTPPYSNSNGGINSLVSHCESKCGESIKTPPWLNDWNAPGWDNRPRFPRPPKSK